MAYSTKASFSGGELDPDLWERTDVEKYRSGLATARNVYVGKTGRLISRAGRKVFAKCKYEDRKCLIYSPPNSGFMIEFGHLYVRTYPIDKSLTGVGETKYVEGVQGYIEEFTHNIPEDQLQFVQFESSRGLIYVSLLGHTTMAIFPQPGGGINSGSALFVLPPAPTALTVTTNGTGYDVDYLVTGNIDREEGLPISIQAGKFCQAPSEVNSLDASCGTQVTEIKVYRKPRSGNGWGYIGNSTSFTLTGGVRHFVFKDLGSGADYNHQPPGYTAGISPYRGGSDPAGLSGATAIVYQQRLILTSSQDREMIVASRTGKQNNFYQDYPLGSDSSLTFKSGTSGYARVLRLMEYDGLVVFTAVGVFLHTGALSPDNLALTKKGNWVIQQDLPAILIPGGVLFSDVSSGAIRQLTWSTEAAGYIGEELSIYSNHLFRSRVITSWGFEDGDAALVWTIFKDGKLATFTYEREQQMRAWTRHDSVGANVEFCCGTGIPNKMYFVVEKDGKRYIEQAASRFLSGQDFIDNPEADLFETIAYMDSMVTKFDRLNDPFEAIPDFSLTPVVPGVWDGPLTLAVTPDIARTVFAGAPYGVVGNVFRWFNPIDRTHIDLTVTTLVPGTAGWYQIVVQPSQLWPTEYTTNLRLYNTFKTITGLGHLEGEDVSVIADGAVLSSPLNALDSYPTITVIGGSITLPDDIRAAVVHVGRPIVGDWETLDIDTVEQRPVEIESKTVNKLYLKTTRSRGLYVGNKLPDDDTNVGMQEIGAYKVDYSLGIDGNILANTFVKARTERFEITLPGDWSGQGRIAGRQVDPLHFEVMSIIPDIVDLRRRGNN